MTDIDPSSDPRLLRARLTACETERTLLRQRFDAVLRALPVGVWITDARGRVEETNPRADELWAGSAPHSASPEAYREYRSWWPDTGRALAPEEHPLTRALATGARVADVEFAIRRFDGTTGVLLAAAAPIVDDQGCVTGAVGVSQDITARRSAEDALSAERELLRSLIRHVPAPVALHVGPDHRYAVLSDTFRAVSGGRDLTGLTPREAYPEVVGQGILERFDEVLATGRPWVSAETPRRLDRRGMGVEDTWFDIRYEPVRDAAGQVVGVLNLSVDVTDQVRARRHAEEQARQLAAKTAELEQRTAALEESEARLRLALSAAEMAYWDFDPTTNTTLRSSHHDRCYGHAEPLAVWNFDTYLAHVHPDDRTYVADRFARALAHDEEWKVESRVVWPDGSIHWIATQGAVSRDADGRPVRVLGIIQDVTARKAAEAERARLHAEAEAARRAAETANRAKSAFLAVMSHELRTPLNAIGGYAELLELGIRGPVTDEQRQDLARIRTSQRHLLGLIAGVLDYSRLEAGAVTYHLADVPVAEAVAGAEALVAPQLRAKGLVFAGAGADPASDGRPLAGEPLRVRADRAKLQQVLLNLLSNAVKFTDARGGQPGRVEVSCEALRAPDGRGAVAIRVRDTGMGIPADKQEAVFEPFVQVDARLTRPHDGTGLGLAISRDLARGMGGDLTAESTPGVGSTFTLTLPGA